LAQSILRNWELAKDASQEAFAKAYFGLKQFREDASFRTWFFRIVFNEAKSAYRREKMKGLLRFGAKRNDEDESESVLDVIPSSDRSPEEVLEASELKMKIEKAIQQLPERERAVFTLRYLHECTLAEAANVLGIAIGTVKAHLSHGAEKMKSILTKEGVCHG
jgi:RNA polymerase sigma-70 factor (ECF subfamily)